MSNKPTYADLRKSLEEAEEILDTLRSHKVDAVVGTDQIALMRLKEVEEQLQEQIQISGSRLKEIESIYRNVPVGLCILDKDLKFVRVNEHLAKIHGIPAEEHMGKKMSELFPNLADNIDEKLREVIDTGHAKMNVELYGELPGTADEKRYLLEHWLPLYNKQGEIIGINMVIEEITERKRYEEKLKQLNATLEERVNERTKVAEQRAEKLREMALQMSHVEEKERQRLARVLHDGLQQLLIGAKFNSQIISNQISEQAEVQEQLEELNQILDQSIEASRSLSYELSPPILHDHGLIAALHWLSEMRHMKGLTINIQTKNEIPKLSQDLKVFLFQVVREFLVNIIKHAEVDTADVIVSSNEQVLSIEVIDKGKGFDIDKVKFGDAKSQGLRNIREKLKLLKGELKIDSKPGKGSHFTLNVPLDEEKQLKQNEEKNDDVQEKAQNIKAGNASSVKSGKIELLVVDDHQLMRSGLVRLLDKEDDIEIIGEASDGVEAVDFVQNTQPDVIIMDITMPNMDGIEATRRIHQKYPNILIIGLSMHEEKEYSNRIKEAGAKTLLNKSGPAEKLFETIREVEA